MSDCKSGLPGKFCALAWIHRFTNVGGEIQVCCTSEELDNTIRDDEGRKLSLNDGLSDEQILNSKFMRDLRRKLLDGEWPELCRRCQITEETGGISRRMDENSHFAEMIPDLLATTEADGRIPVQVKSADYRLGNLCNLACRMCNPYSSTAWNKFAPAGGYVPEARKNNYYESPHFLEHVVHQAPHLEHLHFAGGEPLINPQMEPLLNALVETGNAKNIRLTYNTNLTRVSDRIKTLWPHFKGVQLYVSIDAFGARNEYIRYPVKWADLDRNLRDLDRGFNEYGLEKVAVMTTSQIYNILDLEPLYDYLFANMTHVDKIPKLIDLHVPTFLRTQVLPPHLKRLATSRLLALHAKTQTRLDNGLIKPEEARTLETINGAIHFLELEDRAIELAQFWKFSLALDQAHKKNTLAMMPEMRTPPPPLEKRYENSEPGR